VKALENLTHFLTIKKGTQTGTDVVMLKNIVVDLEQCFLTGAISPPRGRFKVLGARGGEWGALFYRGALLNMS
jgi:hypothetical protein